MNIKRYECGDNFNEVSVAVNVSTPGVAVTKVDLTFDSGVTVRKAESSDSTGIISGTLLDSGDNLKGSLLEISTEIILDHIPEGDWPVCFENLVITYELTGGGSTGNYEVEQPDKNSSDTGKTICVEKYIQFV